MDIRYHYGAALDALAIPLMTDIPMGPRLRLASRMRKAQKHIATASTYLEHLRMADAILKVPAHLDGVAVECGCFKGGSTANLSRACSRAGRELVVFDSFCGLPEPEEGDAEHAALVASKLAVYEQGDYAGTLAEVKANVARFGAIDACEFLPGYFEDTLPAFERPVIFAFIDADLASSVRTCVQQLWPLLQDGCSMFVHEAHQSEIAELFYDREFWDELGESPPGLVGGGSGLGLSVHRLTPLGYAVKRPALVRAAG